MSRSVLCRGQCYVEVGETISHRSVDGHIKVDTCVK